MGGATLLETELNEMQRIIGNRFKFLYESLGMVPFVIEEKEINKVNNDIRLTIVKGYFHVNGQITRITNSQITLSEGDTCYLLYVVKLIDSQYHLSIDGNRTHISGLHNSIRDTRMSEDTTKRYVFETLLTTNGNDYSIFGDSQQYTCKHYMRGRIEVCTCTDGNLIFSSEVQTSLTVADVNKLYSMIENHKKAILDLENDIEEISSLIGTNENNLTNLNTRLNTLSNNVSAINTNVVNLENEVENLSSQDLINTTNINNLSSELTGVKQNITNNAQNIELLSENDVQLEGRITANSDSIDGLEQSIENMPNDIKNFLAKGGYLSSFSTFISGPFLSSGCTIYETIVRYNSDGKLVSGIEKSISDVITSVDSGHSGYTVSRYGGGQLIVIGSGYDYVEFQITNLNFFFEDAAGGSKDDIYIIRYNGPVISQIISMSIVNKTLGIAYAGAKVSAGVYSFTPREVSFHAGPSTDLRIRIDARRY